jgi:hypothetical protein
MVYKVDDRATIVEVVNMGTFFPGFVSKEDNVCLMEVVSKEELQEVFHIFQKYKSPSPYQWPMEFFLWFYELSKGDILRVIEESRTYGKILAAFNTTFIDIIPKMNNPYSFEDYRPFSLCNYI